MGIIIPRVLALGLSVHLLPSLLPRLSCCIGQLRFLKVVVVLLPPSPNLSLRRDLAFPSEVIPSHPPQFVLLDTEVVLISDQVGV